MSVLLIRIVFQMLVVFKSAPILKRVLKVKHDVLQLYVLKVSLFHVLIHSKQEYNTCILLLSLCLNAVFRDMKEL